MMKALTVPLMILSAGACAAVPAKPPPSAAEARGAKVAQAICARCHAVEPTGESPDRRAPTFRSMSGEYVPLTLQRKLTEIAETGHYAMPATPLDSDQVADMVEYLNSLPHP